MGNPTPVGDRLLVWGADQIEDSTIAQAQLTARLPFIHGHVALMPDAHIGKGATIGSVIATQGAIVPAAVGVDIGCGMIAAETSLIADDLPDNIDALMPLIEERVPAGLGKAHTRVNSNAPEQWLDEHPAPVDFDHKTTEKVLHQFGTLGSGNHFLEVCIDERMVVWVVLHSGSRGIGKTLAEGHIKTAKKLAAQWWIPLDDPDLAYFVQGTPEFGAYLSAMNWAQHYAYANRERMMDEALRSLFDLAPGFVETDRINCHHNYTTVENHMGKNVWVTRKGAIRARHGDRGVIPGSMGTRSYIVEGKGNAASFMSCSHGAGRRMSRGEARRTFRADDLRTAMGDRAWNADKAEQLVDEIPGSYKSIDDVMKAQTDLVTVVHTLGQVFNYKGA